MTDDSERLFRRLVQAARTTAPDLLQRPFEVSQVYQHLVPYRTQRRELGFASNDEYELALCQLLSGARGLLTGDREMQEAIRHQLDSPNPDLSIYRAYATARVAFAADALRDALLRPTPESARTVSDRTPGSPVEQATIASRPTQELETPAEARPVVPAPAEPAKAQVAIPEPPSPAPSSMPPARPAPIKVTAGAACRYCGGGLPEGRSVVFCPSCGHNLTIKHCPACNTELEVGWKFCVTCGRDIG